MVTEARAGPDPGFRVSGLLARAGGVTARQNATALAECQSELDSGPVSNRKDLTDLALM